MLGNGLATPWGEVEGDSRAECAKLERGAANQARARRGEFARALAATWGEAPSSSTRATSSALRSRFAFAPTRRGSLTGLRVGRRVHAHGGA